MINLNFKYEEDDYVPALRAYLLRKPKVLVFSSLGYLILMCPLLLFLSLMFALGQPLFLMLALVGWLSLLWLLFYLLPLRRFRNSYLPVDEYQFHITEQGIIYGTENNNGCLPWRRCTKLIEGERFYIFEHDRRRVTVIPKRAFKSDEDENAFRELLRSKLKPTLSKKLLKDKQAPPEEKEYVPPTEVPDWR